MAEIKDLVGLTFASVENKDNDELIFTANDGRIFRFYHSQDCCESVRIESIVGDLNDLVGAPLAVAEAVSNEAFEDPLSDDDYRTHTWTFYKFATIKGYVDVRWLGESNGYYSESVDFEQVKA